jgi:cytochrome P450
MTVWSHLIMGHIFANFQNRDGIRKTAASIASHELNAHIRRAIKQCEEEFEDHILAHMKAARSSFRNLSQDEYEDHMRMILFEFVGSIVMLVGISFGKLIDVLARNKAPPTRLAELMTGPDGERLLEEALRLNTTTRSLLRRATRRVEIGGVTLEPRDYAFLLTGAASAHPSEYRNTPDATVRYLNFGRQGGPHACFGQYWARAILIEMLLALSRATSLKAVDPVTGVRDFAGAPDYFAMEWDDWRQRGAEASSGKGRRP